MEMRIGRKYVLPVYEQGSEIQHAGSDDFVKGDKTRDSVYSTVYPFHEQIEVTNDGQYLVSEDWPTLIRENAREVIMPTNEYGVNKKFYLIDGDSFGRQMDKVIKIVLLTIIKN